MTLKIITISDGHTYRALLQIGGSDEKFYGSNVDEDVDLCLRVSKEGYYLILDLKAKAYHHSDCIQMRRA